MASIRKHLRNRSISLLGSGPEPDSEFDGDLATVNGSISRTSGSSPVVHFVDAGAISEGLDPSVGHFGEYVAQSIKKGLTGTPWLVVIRSNQLVASEVHIPGVRVVRISVRKGRRVLRKVTGTALAGSFPHLRPSTGVMALALLQYWGVGRVDLFGFSMFTEAVRSGHFYDELTSDRGLPRNHSQADAFIIAAIQARFRNVTSRNSGIRALLDNWHEQPDWAVTSLKNRLMFSECSPW